MKNVATIAAEIDRLVIEASDPSLDADLFDLASAMIAELREERLALLNL